MLAAFGVVVCVLSAGAATAEPPVIDESPQVYAIVTETALGALPQPIRGFLQHRTGAIALVAAEAMTTAAKGRNIHATPSRHYVMLDVLSPEDPARFPRDRKKARKQFLARGVEEGGALPWVLLDHQAQLREALRAGSIENIERQAGAVIHYAADAALPFHTASRVGATGRQAALLQQFGERLAFEVRLFPGRYQPIEDAPAAVFEALESANRHADPLMDAAARQLDTQGNRTRRFDPIASAGAEAAPAILESRLEAGALLAAQLIGLAWVEAGRPDLAGGGAPEQSPAAQKRTTGAKYVGSRHSGVFHLRGCPHVRRIKQANLVEYPSIEDVHAAGREPCKTCAPQAPREPPAGDP